MSVHAPVGALIGVWVKNPATAFVLGMLSHFLLDLIPHGDERLLDHLPPGPRMRRLFLYGGLDAAVMSMGMVALFTPWKAFPEMGVLAGAVGGVLPDILQGFRELMPTNRFLHAYYRFHNFFHCEIIRYESPFVVGMLTQLATLIVVVEVLWFW
ncbi:hypothetical protein HY632_03900 [Candidatus Uhrbacteria bacterium]|nr:hypothetical protein [Candidatus Uhrbacteria bacterium]